MNTTNTFRQNIVNPAREQASAPLLDFLFVSSRLSVNPNSDTIGQPIFFEQLAQTAANEGEERSIILHQNFAIYTERNILKADCEETAIETTVA